MMEVLRWGSFITATIAAAFTSPGYFAVYANGMKRHFNLTQTQGKKYIYFYIFFA